MVVCLCVCVSVCLCVCVFVCLCVCAAAATDCSEIIFETEKLDFIKTVLEIGSMMDKQGRLTRAPGGAGERTFHLS